MVVSSSLSKFGVPQQLARAEIASGTDASGEDNQHVGNLAATLRHECVPTNPTGARSLRDIVNAFPLLAY